MLDHRFICRSCSEVPRTGIPALMRKQRCSSLSATSRPHVLIPAESKCLRASKIILLKHLPNCSTSTINLPLCKVEKGSLSSTKISI